MLNRSINPNQNFLYKIIMMIYTWNLYNIVHQLYLNLKNKIMIVSNFKCLKKTHPPKKTEQNAGQ